MQSESSTERCVSLESLLCGLGFWMDPLVFVLGLYIFHSNGRLKIFLPSVVFHVHCPLCGRHMVIFLAKLFWESKWINLFSICRQPMNSYSLFFKQEGWFFSLLQNQQKISHSLVVSAKFCGCRLIVSESSRWSCVVSLLPALFCPDADRGVRGCA